MFLRYRSSYPIMTAFDLGDILYIKSYNLNKEKTILNIVEDICSFLQGGNCVKLTIYIFLNSFDYVKNDKYV